MQRNGFRVLPQREIVFRASLCYNFSMKKNVFAILVLIAGILFPAALAAQEEVFNTSVKDFYNLCTSSSTAAKRESLFSSSLGPLRLVISDENLDDEKLLEAFKRYIISRPVILDLQNVKAGNGMAFENIYSNIVEVIFPEEFSYHFENCKYLQKVRIPRKERTIERYQFNRCHNLREIEVPQGSELEKIEWLSFYWTDKVEKINLPPSVKYIESEVFKGWKGITELNLPNLLSLGSSAFSGCEALERVTLGENINEFGNSFTNCKKLKEITILSPKIKFKDGCFAGCENLETLNIPEDCNYFIKDGVLMDKAQRTIIFALPKCRTEIFRIPDTVVTINEKAFSVNGSIKKITNVPNLENKKFVFAYMKGLEEIQYRDNVIYPGGAQAFRGCTNLKTFTFPKDTVKTGAYFFAGCTSLDNISLPEGLSYTTVSESWENELYGSLFYECSSLKNVKLPGDMPAIFTDMFYKSGIEKIYIPDSVTVIRNRGFKGCEKLSELRLPPALKEIRTEAFADCTSLTKMELPAKLLLIGNGAFKGCTKLTSLVIPPSVVEIEDEVVAGSGVREIVIPTSVKKLGTKTFVNSPSLKQIKFAGSVEDFKRIYTHDSDEALDIQVSCSDRDINLLELTKYYTVEELRKL